MKPILLSLPPEAAGRRNFLLEQGIPVHPMEASDVANLRLEIAGKALPAEIQPEATDAHGKVTWVMLTAVIPEPEGAYQLVYHPEAASDTPKLELHQSENGIVVTTPHYHFEMSGKDQLRLIQDGKTVLDGPLSFSVQMDSRTFVSGVRAILTRSHGFSLEESSASRALVIWKGKVHPDIYREYSGIDERRFMECELEIRLYAAKPVIRLKWLLTSHYNYAGSMEKYALTLPLSKDARLEGDWLGERYASYANVKANGAHFAAVLSHGEDIGAGAGIGIEKLEWIYDEPDGFAISLVGPGALPDDTDGTSPAMQYGSALRPAVTRSVYRLALGGINPPVDGKLTVDIPQVHRTILHGMGRTFSGAIILDPAEEDIITEVDPVYFTAPAQHYSDTGNLPERGDPVEFGEYKDETWRAADFLAKTQWKGTLWFGEWWREYDITSRQGIEESGSGNSALGVFYHYLRTGEKRFLESARRSMLAVNDLTLNKQRNNLGPFVHTRRFLFDRENWHHPRYQRVGSIMRPSHIFCDRIMRKRACDTVRWFAEHFMDADGAPMETGSRDPNGPKQRLTESAMAQFVESLIFAWHETGDEWFLEKAKLQANWVVDQMEAAEDVLQWLGNWNIQFVQRGLLAVILATGEQKFKDAYLKICRNILKIRPVHAGPRELILWEVHFVVYFAWHFAEAHKMTGDDQMLKDFIKVLDEELKRQAADGSFPYVTAFIPRTSEWISYYDHKTAAAYLPAIASRLKCAGINRASCQTK